MSVVLEPLLRLDLSCASRESRVLSPLIVTPITTRQLTNAFYIQSPRLHTTRL